MPTLLQINVTANWGSTGKIAEAIGLCAKNNGWVSYIAYGRMSNQSSSYMIKIGSKMDNYIHYVHNRLFDMEGCGSKRATKVLIRKIEDIKPDVIQLHNIHDHFLNYKILFDYLNQLDIKVVWTFHDCWAFTGHCYHFVQENCQKWQTECCDCVKRNKFIDRSRDNYFLKKQLFTRCQNLTIIPCSEWMSNFVKKSFLKEKRIQVIHNGVDLNIFRRLPKVKKNDGYFRVIAISNVWKQYKGLYDVFRLREILPDNFKMIMVGLTEKQLKILPKGIHGITRTQNVLELVQLYNEADVLINPTYADTFPTVNLEALACGTPVITYRTGGSPEAIDENTGVVVEQGNVEALAEAVRQMRIQPLSSNVCRKRAEDYFDKDRNFEKYIDLYTSLIDNNHYTHR